MAIFFNLKYDSPPQRELGRVCVCVCVHTQSYELYLLLYLSIQFFNLYKNNLDSERYFCYQPHFM